MSVANNDTEKSIGRQIGYYVQLSDEERLKRYQARVSWFKNEYSRWHNEAETWLTYYRNKAQVFTRTGHKVQVPTIIKNTDAMMAALTAFEVVPVVQPKGMTSYELARVQQEALRNEWDELEVIEQSEYAIKEGILTGLGVVKVGYEYEEDENVDDDEEVEPIILKDSVTVEHIPYDEILFDPTAKKWEDITWIAQRYTLPLEEVQADPKFQGTENLKPTSHITDRWTDKAGNRWKNLEEVDEDTEFVDLYQMWDLVRGTICWFSPDHDQILREGPNPFAARASYKKRNPYVPYITRTDPGSVPGISDPQVMRPSVDAQNIIRSSLTNFVARMKPKLVAEDGVITDNGKKALRSQEWGEVVTVRNGALGQGAITPLQMPNMPQEFFQLAGEVGNDADDAIGMNELLGGELPEGRKTATAMQQLGQATSIRQSEKRNHLARFYGGIADRMLYLMQGLYEQPRIVRLVQEMGDVVWDWDADDISFESAVTCAVEPREILDADQKREKFLAMLNILGADPTVNQVELKTYILRDGLGIPAEIVRKVLKTQDQVDKEADIQRQQQLTEKATGPGSPVPEPFDLNVNPSMEPGALGGPPPTLQEAAATGGVASAAPLS